jgi:phosphatidylserine decarboxylase
VTIDSAALPFVAVAALPATGLFAAGMPLAAGAALLLPLSIALFFRDPERTPPADPSLVLAPADGKVMHAGPARPDEAPAGAWLQVTIFLSLLDVHINRAPVGGRVTQVRYVPGSFVAAFRPESHRNEHSEVWIDRSGVLVVARQVVGLLARRVVCRLSVGDDVRAGDRIGLMKFWSRMDVFVPPTARLLVKTGDVVRGAETGIARLTAGSGEMHD